MLDFLFKLKHRNFLRLWFAQLISQFGDRIHQLALVALIAERSAGTPADAMSLAKVMSFTILPAFLIQPFAGVFVDRWDRRTTLFFCDIFRGLLVLLIPAIFIRWESLVPIYIIVFLIFCFPRLYVPAKMSIIPDLVHTEENLLKANSLITTTGMIASALGVALGSVIMEWYGARNGFIIDAGTFFISAVFLFGMTVPWRLRLEPKDLVHSGKRLARDLKEKRKSVAAEMKEGFRYILEHKDIRFVMATMFLLFSVVGAVYIVIIVFIQETFGSVTKHLGWMIFCFVGGLFLGLIAYGSKGERFKWHKTIYGCLAASGCALTAFAVAVYHFPSIWVGGALAVLFGFVVGPIFIAANTILHVVSDEEMRGKVFSAMEIVIHAAFLITMLLSSWLAGFVPKVWILSGAGAVCVIIGALGFLRHDLENVGGAGHN